MRFHLPLPLALLQRLVRAAPGLSTWAWGRMPGGLRARLAPLLHPVAAGPRGSGFALPVPDEPRRGPAPEAPGSTVSIVIVTHARADLCEACLLALFRNTSRQGLEVVVVDNASTDGTAGLLARWSAREPLLRVVRNTENLGFARATNQGIRETSGDVVVLLNDDTVVGPGWLPALVRHLHAQPSLGLVCPATNEIGNEAKIAVDYTTFEGMEEFATRRGRELRGCRRTLPVVALFCAAARRSVLEEVGLLDERYAVGMFEDDDLALSLGARGFVSAVADDAFVHHVGQASFSRLPDREYLAIWQANRARFEAKWGRRWMPPTQAGG